DYYCQVWDGSSHRMLF
nr:immunoglobulin light chain junction region [Macaca mulatta]MOW31468.1 immunoglobulin light chain junction region [Macaca mulatta]MOW31697.1 immunoglobulin light chain junction region [Macaca mulatta]